MPRNSGFESRSPSQNYLPCGAPVACKARRNEGTAGPPTGRGTDRDAVKLISLSQQRRTSAFIRLMPVRRPADRKPHRRSIDFVQTPVSIRPTQAKGPTLTKGRKGHRNGLCAHTTRTIRRVLAQDPGQVEQRPRTTGQAVGVGSRYRLAVQTKAGLLQRHQAKVCTIHFRSSESWSHVPSRA